MIKIPLKKLKYRHIQVLQRELELFVAHVTINDLKSDFLNAITSLDIANNLYFILRNKMEQDKNLYTISFTVSQAAIIMKCCYHIRKERTEEEDNIMLQYAIELDQKLKSLNKHTQIPLLNTYIQNVNTMFHKM